MSKTLDKRQRLRLRHDQAQAVALVYATEQIDRSGQLLDLEKRRQATRKAREAAGKKAEKIERWIGLRAVALEAELRRDEPRLPWILRAANPARGLLLPVILISLFIGLATHALDSHLRNSPGPVIAPENSSEAAAPRPADVRVRPLSHRIHVLAFPLLGLIVWNLAILFFVVLRRWLPGSRTSEGPKRPRLLTFLEHGAERLIERLPARRRRDGEQAVMRQELLRRVLTDFLAAWWRATTPLAITRIRRLLNASALAMVAGVVAGMYLRGILLDYSATWESTFLGGDTVDTILGTILGPASAVTGIEIPKAQLIRSPLAGPAAPWIHLWAATAALFVGVPRLLLILSESLRCGFLERRVELELSDAYLRRLVASARTTHDRIEILPYSYTPSPQATDRLKSLLYDLFGPRAELRTLSQITYGSEPAELEPPVGRSTVVLFNLAQTPEIEVHGELLETLKEALPDGHTLIVLVDGSVYRGRLEATTVDERISQRRRAWDRVAQAAGLEAVHLELEDAPADELLTRIAEAAWPAGALEEGR